MKTFLRLLTPILILIVVTYTITSLIVTPSIPQTSFQTIQLRRDTTANWTSVNPIPYQGEPCYDTTLKKIKIGDGINHWLDLPFSTYTLTELQALVPTFINSLLRTGDDVALVGDALSPGNSKFYGTNGSGTKAWYSQIYPIALNFQYSLTQSGVNVNLVNDSSSPGNGKYYGTNDSGVKGYIDFPFGRWASYTPAVPFGTGADGDVTISTDTTLSAGTDGVKVMNYNNLTVNSSKYLEGNSSDHVLVILVKGTLTINGTIKMDGRGGVGGSSGSGAGGNGGIPGGGYVLGQNGSLLFFFSSAPTSSMPFEILRYLYGGGGLGGTGNSGGTGGGVIWIEASDVVWGGSGLVSCNGIVGSDSMEPLGVGGSGGGGGSIESKYITQAGTPNFEVNGGVGGAGGSGGQSGQTGTDGFSSEFKVY